MAQAAKEVREIIGEISEEHAQKLRELNAETQTMRQATRNMINACMEEEQARLGELQKKNRAIWDDIAKEHGLDVVKDVFVVEPDKTTGVNRLVKIVQA